MDLIAIADLQQSGWPACQHAARRLNIERKEHDLSVLLRPFPREMLDEEFLQPLGLTKYRLAKDIGVPAQRVGDIVAGKRSIKADTDLGLCRYFGLSDAWWLGGLVASWPSQLRHGDRTRFDGRRAFQDRAL